MSVEKRDTEERRSKMTDGRVLIFDTTLRDGEQSPGCRMSLDSKIIIAQQLERLGVDIIEAGFPVASEGEFNSVSRISQLISGSVVCALARTREKDIRKAVQALEKVKCSPRVHTFVATSDVHLREKLHKSPSQILDMVKESIELAKRYVNDVEFSPEDATRTGREFLAEVVKVAIEAGATTINIPDTVGYSVGREYFDLITYLKKQVPELNSVVISAHCHNDLGLAVSNTLSAVEAGARQLECCVLGIGERAGNAQLEAVVMALKTRVNYYGIKVDLDTVQLGRTARLVSSIIGKEIPDTLPIVGGNVFAHGAGIHQDGTLKERTTYEIITPENVGWEGESTPLVKHSGRHALRSRLKALGYSLNKEIVDIVYGKFTDLADDKTYVYNKDLHLLVQEVLLERDAKSGHLIMVKRIDYHRVKDELSATVTLSQNGGEFEASGTGDGPVDCVFDSVVKALARNNIDLTNSNLIDFSIGKGPGGSEAIGVVTLQIEKNGDIGYGRGSDTDIVVASVKAVVSAINHLLRVPVRIES